MMASSAAITSVRSTSLFLNFKRRLKRLGRRPILEDERLGPPRLRFRHDPARLFARHAVAIAGQLLDQGDHFLRILLPNYLKKQ